MATKTQKREPRTAEINSPISLQRCHDNLLHLVEVGRSQESQLYPAQAKLFSDTYEAWIFYRASQPANYRASLDRLCDRVGNYAYAVGV